MCKLRSGEIDYKGTLVTTPLANFRTISPGLRAPCEYLCFVQLPWPLDFFLASAEKSGSAFQKPPCALGTYGIAAMLHPPTRYIDSSALHCLGERSAGGSLRRVLPCSWRGSKRFCFGSTLRS